MKIGFILGMTGAGLFGLFIADTALMALLGGALLGLLGTMIDHWMENNNGS